MREQKISKKMVNTEIEGIHARKRSRTRWIDQIKKDIEIIIIIIVKYSA